MAGFAIVYQPNLSVEARAGAFEVFLKLVAEFKGLAGPALYATGQHCTGAKLNGPASLHRRIISDAETGSWLLATGTVVKLADGGSPDPSLQGLLADYLENGIGSLNDYDGQFALVIYDGREHSLSVISDPVGHFSIFYGSSAEGIFVSSSALAVARQICPMPDILAVESFLTTGTAIGEQTLWQGIKRLAPGSLLKITPTGMNEFEYWRPSIDPSVARLAFDEALDHAVEVLSFILARALEREERFWADLTGGFDSRLTTMMLDKCGLPFIANCFGPADHPDAVIAQRISQAMGWEYRHFALPEVWTPEDSTWFRTAVYRGDARLPTMGLATALRGHELKSSASRTHVVGLGGEDWRGYYYSGELFKIGRTREVAYDALINRSFPFPVPANVLRNNPVQEVRRELRRFMENVFSPYAELPNSVKLDRYSIRDHTTNGGAFLPATVGIVRSITPLSFKATTNLGFSLNYKWKLPRQYRFVRALIERVNPRLANMPTAAGGPAAPIRLTNMHKHGPVWKGLMNAFSEKISRGMVGRPVTIWRAKAHHAKYPLPGWQEAWLGYAEAEGLLDPGRMCTQGLYHADGLRALVSRARAGDFRHQAFLDNVVTVETAMRAVGTDIE